MLPSASPTATARIARNNSSAESTRNISCESCRRSGRFSMPGRAVGRSARDSLVSALPTSGRQVVSSRRAYLHTRRPVTGHPTGAASDRWGLVTGVPPRTNHRFRVTSTFSWMGRDPKTVAMTFPPQWQCCPAYDRYPRPLVMTLQLIRRVGRGHTIRSGENYTGMQMGALYFAPSRLCPGAFYHK
jgi:hypothetical protein